MPSVARQSGSVLALGVLGWLLMRASLYGASPMPRPLIGRAMVEMGPIFMRYY